MNHILYRSKPKNVRIGTKMYDRSSIGAMPMPSDWIDYSNPEDIIKTTMKDIIDGIESKHKISYSFLLRFEGDGEVHYVWKPSTFHNINRYNTRHYNSDRVASEIFKEYQNLVDPDKYEYNVNNIQLIRIEINVYKIAFSRNITPLTKVSRNKNITNKQLKGGSYVELPKCLKSLNSLLNIKNRDNMCFIWCIIAALHPAESNPTRIVHYKPYLEELKLEGIEFPVGMSDVNTFAELNCLEINVWELKIPLFESTRRPLDKEDVELTCILATQGDDHVKSKIDLLLFRGHFILIKNLGVFVKWVLGVNYGVIVCARCNDSHFKNVSAYEKHLVFCGSIEENQTAFEMPKEIKDIKFRNHQNVFKAPFCMYADFEAILEEHNEKYGDCSHKINIHRAIAVGFALKRTSTPQITEQYLYGTDCVAQFFDEIKKITRTIKHEMTQLFARLRTCQAEGQTCFFCEKAIEKKCVIVKNEAVYNNLEFKAHFKCMATSLEKMFSLRVFFHNLRGYDSHFLVDEFARICTRFSVIPISREKYISFQGSINGCNIRFLDTLAFLHGSLASNASKLSSFEYIGSPIAENKSNFNLEYLAKYQAKQAFPYEYVSSVEVLENEGLPHEKSKWHSKLTGRCPSDNEINFAHTVMTDLNLKTIKEYMMFYLRIDVLLLLEVYESFRSLTLSQYGLDPAHYFTTPGMAWDAALRFSGQNLQMLDDPRLVEFFCQKGTIRGGISTVSEKKWQSIIPPIDIEDTQKYMQDKNESIFYFDVTNLYGYAMTFPLPVGGFSFIYQAQTDSQAACKDDVWNLIWDWDVDGEWGYIFEVDIEVPPSVHDKHNELPFLAERINERLAPTLLNKTNYRTHIIILRQALQHGLILREVHRVVKFRQKKWLKDYIERNTNMRAATKDENMRNFFKLMNNAVYGKTMENIFKRCKHVIVQKSETERIQKLVQTGKINSLVNITPNIMVGNKKSIPVFDKAVYVGFCILEISKYHMYFLLYDVIKPKWPSSQLMYMDTDSFIVNIHLPYDKMDYGGVEKYFDLSVYPKTSRHHIPDNKGILGTLKDEYASTEIVKFVCLKSKCYVVVTANGNISVKNKGVSSNADLWVGDFEAILEERLKNVNVKQFTIKSFDHLLYTIEFEKKALGAGGDLKRVYFLNGSKGGMHQYETKAIGHHTTINK